MARDLGRLRQQHPRLWYVAEEGLGSQRGGNIEGYLIRHAYLALDQWYAANRLLLFGTGDAGPLRPMDVAFEGGIRLSSAVVGERAAPGGVLPVRLAWQAANATDRRLKVFVHLIDGAGRRPTDSWAAGERVDDRLGVLIPEGTPAGSYRVEVGLYDPDSGERVATAGGEDRVVLPMAVSVEADR